MNETDETTREEVQETTSQEEGVDIDTVGMYELAFHLVPTLDDEGRTSRVEELRKAIESKGGVILNEVHPEHVELEYTMSTVLQGKRSKYDTAYFGWISFELPKEHTEELKSACEKDTSILRYLLVSTTRELAIAQNRFTFAGEKEVVVEASVAPEKAPVEEPKEIVEEEVDKAIDDLVVDEEPAQKQS